jgi:hypothetical protein
MHAVAQHGKAEVGDHLSSQSLAEIGKWNEEQIEPHDRKKKETEDKSVN